MRRVSVILALLAALMVAKGQGPDDQYILIYNLIQEADALNRAEQPSRALSKYLEAQAGLQKLQKVYPDWNAKVVNFRMNYLGSMIGEVTRKVPAAALAPENSTMPPAAGRAGSPTARPGAPGVPANWGEQRRALESQIRRLEDDRVSLEAKLKEALSAQPARTDPRELARAEERIRGLLKENDLLKVSLEQEKTKPPTPAEAKALEQAQQALLQAKRSLAEQSKKADALEKEKAALQAKLRNLPPSAFNAGAIEDIRKELEAANRRLSEQTKLADNLAAEKRAMQVHLNALEADHEAVAGLRAENQVLKKAMTELKSTSKESGRSTDTSRQLAQAQSQIATLTSEKEILHQQNLSLENRVKQLTKAAASAPSTGSDDAKRIRQLEQEREQLRRELEASARELKSARAGAQATATAPTSKAEESARVKKLQAERDGLKEQLELANKQLKANQVAAPGSAKPDEGNRLKRLDQERDDLKQQLQAASKELNRRKGKIAVAHVLEMEKEVAGLRARLEVLEARQVPYTPEELALFRKPEAKPVVTEAKRSSKAGQDLPPGTVTLAAEAKRYFSAKQLDKAEDKYLQVLRQAQNNVPTLVNLAAVELELNHLELAETNIQQALSLAPDDQTCLLTLGQLRHRQGQYDAALDALGRAAKVEPRSAEIQNCLRLTLSAKGMRGPAETALRKAVQLDPGYGEAQNNLAVIYATQQPPLIELARWHYQKALAAGSSPNPNLERLFQAKQAAEGSRP